MSILYHSIDDTFLIDTINRAESKVSLTAPGISMSVATALLNAAERLDGNVHLLVDASPESFYLGYCNPEVIRFLQQGCLKQDLHTFRSEQGMRIGVFTVDEETIFFTPDVMTMEKFSSLSINGASSHVEQDASGTSIGLTELTDIVILEAEVIPLAIPQTKEEQLQAALREKQAKIDILEKKMKDLEREKGKLPIQQNLQFVDLEVSQYRLDKLRIRIPSKFLTDTQAVNERMDSKYLVIDSNEKWDDHIEFTICDKKESYSITRFFAEIEQLRNAFTVRIGPWKRVILIENKFFFNAELDRLRNVARAIREKLPSILENKLKERLNELFLTLKRQIYMQYPRTRDNHEMVVSDEDLRDFFFSEMFFEINHTLKFFNPQINAYFRGISSEDAENPNFRKEIEKSFGKKTAEWMFTEVKGKVPSEMKYPCID